MRRSILTALACAWMIGAMPVRGQVIVAHRGASHDAPENTLAAYRLAWEQNADGAEGDFYLTKDGKVVCIHDATTGRTGDVDLPVAQSTLAELRKVDLGVKKGAKYAGERIATLEEVLALVPAGKMYYIEVKCGPEILPAMEEIIARSPVKAEQLRIISFDAGVIAAAKKRLPRIKAHWISGFKKDNETGALRPTPERVVETLKRIGADGFNAQANLTVLTKEFIGQLKGDALEVAAWTVDDPAVARALVEVGVWGLTTNRPGWLREQLGR
jgi:glycerophosphoryl diester phosphodiesterase